MTAESDRTPHRAGSGGFVRRTVEGAFDATVGRVTDRVGETAREVTGATARQVVDDLEPYLAAETIPRIVDALVPYLTESLVPEVVDGVSGHIAEQTVPQVISDATPTLVDQNLPVILEQLRPYLEAELVPAIVDALIPHINSTVAPQVVDAMMPTIRDELAPQIVDALMPKIRQEVVPQILDDIVDDPKVRALIREQSQGMILDTLERLRQALARADDVVERILRRVVGKRPREIDPPPAVQPLPSRHYVNAGLVSRGLALAVDTLGVGFLINAGVSSFVGLLESIFGTLPNWLMAIVLMLGFSVYPLYLALSWTLVGKTVADAITGQRLCDRKGRRIGLVRALVRAWAQVLFAPIWLTGMITSPYARARRVLLDMLTGCEVRYFVHGESHDDPRRRLLAREEK
ncbi:MAG: RDD family protein [Actinobacteria bacterium]|nr:RDD family protein [Actinomycetota bacterium]